MSLDLFRKLHEGPDVLVLANAWDGGSARLVESLGAAAIATTSAGVAWALGYPDDGGMPAEVAIGAAANIARVLRVPLTVDFEHGYSDDPAVVAAHVARLVDAGVVGINLEDGAGAPEVLTTKVAAVKAACEVFVNVRTDVYLRGLAQADPVDEVLARAVRYREAGADGLFVPGVVSPEEIRRIAAGAELPLNVMAVPGLPPLADLGALGVRRLSAGTAVAQTVWGTARTAVAGFLDTGGVSAGPPPMEYGELQGLMAG